MPLAWDHNAYYHRLLLRRLPPGVERVLDVGCGAGELAIKLAGRARQVDAIDRNRHMIDLARARVPPNVTTIHADVMTYDLAAGSYDAVVSMSALHHLEPGPALSRLADALRPGGVLAVIALPRRDLPREVPVELAATTWHHLLGAVFVATGHPLRRGVIRVVRERMPMTDPTLTTRQVRAAARGELPEVRVRRLLLWRYLLLWTKPA